MPPRRVRRRRKALSGRSSRCRPRHQRHRPGGCGFSPRSSRSRSTSAARRWRLRICRADEADDALGAPAIEIGLELASLHREADRPAAGSGHRCFGGVAAARRTEGRGQGDRAAEGHADRDRRCRSGGDAERVRTSRRKTIRRSRRCRPQASTEFGRRRSNRDAELRGHSGRTRARSRPRIGTGESARRIRATWQKELVAHLDKHKRYPAERRRRAPRSWSASRSTGWAMCSRPHRQRIGRCGLRRGGAGDGAALRSGAGAAAAGRRRRLDVHPAGDLSGQGNGETTASTGRASR